LRTEDITVALCNASGRTRFSFSLVITKEDQEEQLLSAQRDQIPTNGRLDIKKTKKEVETFFDDHFDQSIDDVDVYQVNDCLIVVEYYTDRKLLKAFFRI